MSNINDSQIPRIASSLRSWVDSKFLLQGNGDKAHTNMAPMQNNVYKSVKTDRICLYIYVSPHV